MSEFRNNLRDEMDKVQRGYTFLVERFGKPTAAVIPVELYEQLRQGRQDFQETLESLREQADLSEEEAMERALEAQKDVRRRPDE